jgi:hypothetical protein
MSDLKFCPRCGTSVMARRYDAPMGESIRLNVGIYLYYDGLFLIMLQARAFRDIDLDALEVETYPGSKLGHPYCPPEPATRQEGSAGEDALTIYYGNCHCGAVKYSVKTTPLTVQKVMSCNCSLCSRVRFSILSLCLIPP